jgi:hypothetical protein
LGLRLPDFEAKTEAADGAETEADWTSGFSGNHEPSRTWHKNVNRRVNRLSLAQFVSHWGSDQSPNKVDMSIVVSGSLGSNMFAANFANNSYIIVYYRILSGSPLMFMPFVECTNGLSTITDLLQISQGFFTRIFPVAESCQKAEQTPCCSRMS